MKKFYDNNNQLLCIYLELDSTNYHSKVDFFTDPTLPLQIARMSRPENEVIKPHIHKKNYRNINITAEVLFIISGSMRVDLFDEKKIYHSSFIAKSNSIIALYYGGHGFEIIEEVKMLEIKQGPYSELEDKSRFNYPPGFFIKIEETND